MKDLQAALKLLVERGILPSEGQVAERELAAGLQGERAEKTFGPATRTLVRLFQEYLHLPATGQVDEQTAEALNRWLAKDTALTELRQAGGYLVRGFVRFGDGFPASQVNVRAFDRDLRTEQLLGESITDRTGAYRIDYSESQVREHEPATADLVVKAFDHQGEQLAVSPILFNAPREADIDVTISDLQHMPPTLFEKIGAAIGPVLGSLEIEDLEEDQKDQDLTFLSGETGFEKGVLARFVLAHHLARRGIEPEFWFALLGGSLLQYAEDKDLKENLAIVWAAVASLGETAVRKALASGSQAREIREVSQQEADEWVEQFLSLIADEALHGKEPTLVQMALDHAGIRDGEKQLKFSRLYNQYKALTPELLQKLEKDKSFKKAEIADLRTSFRLAELTRGDFSVVKMLKEEFEVRRPEQIRKLAGYREREWVELIERKHKAGEIVLPLALENPVAGADPDAATLYAKSLERSFREAFPTAAFASGLERALHNGGAHGIRYGDRLGRLIERQPEFDLLTTPIDEFFNNGIRPELRALAKDESFRQELKAVQRIFKLAPRFEATDSLLADGVHSAQMVYRMGQSEFVRSFTGKPGFSEESARRAWNRAAETHAAVMTVIGDLKSLDPGSLPAVLKNDSTPFSKFPNWENLFQAGDICHCEHCRSVLGPAAYFADLLVFLKDRKAKNPAETVKDILFKRRPDLGYLELNCENALTTLPYVDVVCEVLERVIAAGDNDVQLMGFSTIPAGTGAKAAVAGALAAQNLGAGTDFSLSQVDPANPDLWVVHGDERTYLLKKKAVPDFFAEVVPNTKAGSEELRAYPAYVNPKAYSKLREARFPFSSPFDLFAEEVRAAFRKCTLQRWDLMRTLRGPAAPNNPTDGELAAEYFGISCDGGASIDEKRLILHADPTDAGQKEAWGEKGNAGWLAALSNVKTFLKKSGLEYDELLTLLDLPFINPNADILIQHQDSSCDTDKKVIQGLDANKLDRIHRFLRMWRKLSGWKMWELDLTIRSSAIGNGGLDEPFLINLYFVSRLQTRLGAKTTVAQLCALFDNLSTETYFTKLHEKRSDGFYQSLFLDRKLMQPVDPAFSVAAVDVGEPTAEKISGHRPVVLAALGLKETDLDILAGLTRASNGLAYITDDLTLGNLSFIWRHAWLAKLLKLKVEEWKTVLKLLQQDVASFTSPEAAFEFVESVDQLKATGFSPDQLNWILAAERSAKAAVKETDAARFLAGLRGELQRIRAEHDSAHYAFLDPPADTDRLTGLLMSLLQQLHRDEGGAQFFIATLRDEIVQEKTVAGLPAGFTFPAAITGSPKNVRIRYTPVLHFGGSMTSAQKTVLLNDPALATVTGLPSYQQAIEALSKGTGPVSVPDLPPGFSFPAAITGAPNHIPIRYDPALRFTGLMMPTDRTTLLTDPLLAAVTGIPSYQQAIEEFFQKPRLAMKFLEPVFTAPLSDLPAALDFQTLPDPALALRISYDAEERVLRSFGILSKDEKDQLDNLSADLAYRHAVNSLFTQPALAGSPENLWLQDADLKLPLHNPADPANDHLNENLATAIKKALTYLSRALSENFVVQQSSSQLGLTEALTRRLVTDYVVLGSESLVVHLTGAFAATHGVVDHATLPLVFDGWFWANRAAALWKKWSLARAELDRLNSVTAGARLLDIGTLPLDQSVSMAPIDRFVRTSRLLRFKDALPETGITLLEVLEKLNGGDYSTTADFAADIERVYDAWNKEDIEALVSSLDLAYPHDYLLAESWERLRRAFYFMENLNASARTVAMFGSASMTDVHAKTLKELLRSKFGADTWLSLSTEIQDALRQRKRDALCSYLLVQPKPAEAPTGKWENTNDLYAYYLLDVEMSACQLTSRLVQASGSVQLFVQRCFMGLEPDVVVKADGPDGDSAWRWWKWMRKYRVWEANRKIFLWPENWIEPELKRDRSAFFKELESEIEQNDVNQFTVETAFANYLEKLDRVAQLEIAGFYQEDDGDNSIIHVFGRTPGAEPHTYYYRRFDYRQWTPWEKVDLDIQGDYLIPAVVNGRLFLFWPVFTEVDDEAANNEVSTPGLNQPHVSVPTTWKKLKLQLAVSDYRQGKWTPKRISKDSYESANYDVDIVRKFYRFFPLDRTEIDGRFGVKVDGWSLGSDGWERAGFGAHAFEIAGCRGVPEAASIPGNFKHVIQPEWASIGAYQNKSYTNFMKWTELGFPDEFGHLVPRHDPPQNDFTLENTFASTTDALRYTPVLVETPWFFKMIPPWHLSYLDKLVADGLLAAFGTGGGEIFEKPTEFPVPVGSWLPFFYNDKKRTFFVLPTLWRERQLERVEPAAALPGYYPDVKRYFRTQEDHFRGQVTTWVQNFDLGAMTSAQRQQLEVLLQARFPGEIVRPFTDEQLRELMVRFLMRFVHFYLGGASFQLFQFRRFDFRNFYHPFVCDFSKIVNNPAKGITALMKRETQLKNSGFSFPNVYKPTPWVAGYPEEIVDFSPDGAYSPYNWELFFHAPLLIGNTLSRNQRFEEASDWYHFIFNPIGVESAVPGGSVMSKYWITKPFFETTDPQYVQQRIENIMRLLAGDASVPGYSLQLKKRLEDQVFDWRTNPFEPHRIANYRTVAYQKTVVMKYLENLIAWGDYLFRQDSMESTNEATQLYILAAELLGPPPKRIPPHVNAPVESFNELEKQFDSFSNALVDVENLIPHQPGVEVFEEAPPIPMLYFCIPPNEKMQSLRENTADRLYKLRHCMNIEGVVRQLALFEPPIDPAALVKAVAAGLDISSALSDLNAPLPVYRFNVLLQKANEVCNDVKALGNALLAALEKRDGEALTLLRQTQEIRVLEAVKSVREKQIDEANENLEGLKKSMELAELKKQYYENRDFLNTGEAVALTLHTASCGIDSGIAAGYSLAGGLKLIPQFILGGSGFGGSPHAVSETGGRSFGESSEDLVKTLESIAGGLDKSASLASTMGSYVRRQDDWDFQADLASKEIEQLDKQIAATELRVAIAQKELGNQVTQIENAKAVDAFMRSKYTNEELYQWQVGQISGAYFQSYKLAYDLAKRAERCAGFELGSQDGTFINFGYWDSLKRGLLAGEKLQYDLRRLETAYLEQNRREFELVKHVSLALLDPFALVRLREIGRCVINLPEELFDLDYPGHYFRRIKSVSLTLPCIAGPNTTVSCTLRLLRNGIRINTLNGDNGYLRNTDDEGMPADDDRFVENNIPVRAIAASSGQNDSGIFELNFRDDRYLPFEGAGVISQWSLELFNDLETNNPDPSAPDYGRPLRQIDYDSISDAVLHIKYTAREDAGPLKNSAITHLRQYLAQDEASPSVLLLNLRRDFPTAWSRFLNPTVPANGNIFELNMTADLFPLRDTGKTLEVNTVYLLARCTDSGNYGGVLTLPSPSPASAMSLKKDGQYGSLHTAETPLEVEIEPAGLPKTWQFKMTSPGGSNLETGEVKEIFVLLRYNWA